MVLSEVFQAVVILRQNRQIILTQAELASFNAFELSALRRIKTACSMYIGEEILSILSTYMANHFTNRFLYGKLIIHKP